MISIRSKLKPTTMSDSTSVIPEIIYEPPTPSMKPSVDFNLVLIVQEHGPTRIEEISEEVAALQNRVAKLLGERNQIQKLLDALDTNS